MVLRCATQADFGDLIALTRAAYEAFQTRIGRAPEPLTADYREILGRDLVWLSEEAGASQGLLVLREESDYLLIFSVAVHPEAQGRGLGQRLMALAKAEAGRLGYGEIRLYTNALMTENIALYRRLGYAEFKRAPNALHPDSTVVHMRLLL